MAATSVLNLPVSKKKFATDLYGELNKDDVFSGAAALSFYLTLALFPGLIFLLTLLPYLPIENLDRAIMDFIRQAMPGEAASLVADVVQSLVSDKKGGLLSLSLFGTLWAATSGFSAVITQLNVTYDVTESRSYLKAKATAFLMMLAFAAVMVIAFALIVLGGVLQDYLESVLGLGPVLLTAFVVFRWVILFFMIIAVFALIYYLGPDVEQDFRFITPGSLFAAVTFALASLGFNWYVSNFGNYNSTYGSIGGVIILMLWLYVAGIVLLVGAETNALIEHHHPQGKDKGERVPEH
ncbi:MAG: YihY/virulence factor BrkB family protein [Bdellovibrionales bacterium]